MSHLSVMMMSQSYAGCYVAFRKRRRPSSQWDWTLILPKLNFVEQKPSLARTLWVCLYVISVVLLLMYFEFWMWTKVRQLLLTFGVHCRFVHLYTQHITQVKLSLAAITKSVWLQWTSHQIQLVKLISFFCLNINHLFRSVCPISSSR